MEETKILTEKDEKLVLPYLELLNTGLNQIQHLYADQRIIQEAREKYTPLYLNQQIRALKPDNRFWADINAGELEGILIEGFETKKFEPESEEDNISKIVWIVTKYPGQGIGTHLMSHYLARANIEKRDAVALSVSELNNGAINMYQRQGFKELARENGIIGMYKFLNPRMDPTNWNGNDYIGSK